jgi:hypothetical protein
MRLLKWLGVLVAAYVAVACAVGTNVAVNGQPTAWGTCK